MRHKTTSTTYSPEDIHKFKKTLKINHHRQFNSVNGDGGVTIHEDQKNDSRPTLLQGGPSAADALWRQVSSGLLMDISTHRLYYGTLCVSE